MIINAGNLTTLFTAFKAAFQGGLTQAASQYGTIATTVPSTWATASSMARRRTATRSRTSRSS